ncbi:unnamed protein product [Cercopithifilaria johnstoni]|uniref:C2H2-type domain-containing protein n=1 Tax=Cercopithifilaria johnstoni TaxID=2874296 RepID=A0A8J2Q0L8_9BILA|nr:unnamed protein product [Cercopithifilaria johnstoni]
MHLPYYLVLLVLPLYVAQITISNDQSIQGSEGKIMIVADNSEVNEKRYQCEVCGVLLGRLGTWNLKRHQLTHEDERLFECHVCNKTFKECCKLKRHKLTHGNERPFKCHLCSAAFNDPSSLKRHQLTHASVRLFRCEKWIIECFENLFASGEDLYEECLFSEANRKFWSVVSENYCGKDWGFVITFGHRSCGLPECIKRLSLLVRQISLHWIGCLLKIFFEKTLTISTLLDHVSVILFGAVCVAAVSNDQRIQEGIENEGKIKSMANNSEANETRYQCKACGVLFGRSDTLINHRMIHIDEKNYKCEMCNKTFDRSDSLKRHQLMHRNERPFKCHVCNKTFKESSKLKRHKLAHGNERPFKCHVCNGTFKGPWNLKRHQWTHENERPFKCHLCSAAFKDSCSLKRHQLTHGNERPFKCHVCSTTFKYSSVLKRHQLTHENDRPFKSEMCGRNLTAIGCLNRHMKIHKSSDEKLYSTKNSLMISIADDIIDTEIFIKEVIGFAKH